MTSTENFDFATIVPSMHPKEYWDNISIVYEFLIKKYPEPGICFVNGREKIKYFMTKHFVTLPENINEYMNRILQYEIYRFPVTDMEKINPKISVIKHDITQIKAAAIVNAANADGLGCFDYNHKCIDNIIHNKAGPELRLECQAILLGSKINTSDTIITSGYNLPCKYIIHTVGPIYNKQHHDKCCQELSKCYQNCLMLTTQYHLKTIVFPCISTGIYGFPKNLAAPIAINAVKYFLNKTNPETKIIFCTYEEDDFELYSGLI